MRCNRKKEEKHDEVVNLDAEKEAEIKFYKNENGKLDERISSLLDINSKLKEQLTKKSP